MSRRPEIDTLKKNHPTPVIMTELDGQPGRYILTVIADADVFEQLAITLKDPAEGVDLNGRYKVAYVKIIEAVAEETGYDAFAVSK